MKHTMDRFEPSLSRSFSVIFSVKFFFSFLSPLLQIQEFFLEKKKKRKKEIYELKEFNIIFPISYHIHTHHTIPHHTALPTLSVRCYSIRLVPMPGAKGDMDGVLVEYWAIFFRPPPPAVPFVLSNKYKVLPSGSIAKWMYIAADKM
ncbi:hypothetical protein I7I48_07751 [Histoplasma ohiense]|nr:hypothetical protein I7I48_07751 [Histoplasma ohiense (nom. inval.)]